MRLSDAMLQGIAKRPQTRGVFFGMDDFGEQAQLCSCALGAAIEGCGLIKRPTDLRGMLQGDLQDKILHEYKVLNHRYIHPVRNVLETLVTIIVTLNDEYDWTREAIAAWLQEQGL